MNMELPDQPEYGVWPPVDQEAGATYQEGLDDPTCGIVSDEIATDSEMLPEVYLPSEAPAITDQEPGLDGKDEAVVYDEAVAEVAAVLRHPDNYIKKHDGLFFDPPASRGSIAGVDLEYATPEGAAVIHQYRTGAVVQFIGDDERTAICNHYYEIPEPRQDASRDYHTVIRKFETTPLVEDSYTAGDEVEEMHRNTERQRLDRIQEARGSQPDQLADAKELGIVADVLRSARPVSKNYDDVVAAIGRQAQDGRLKPEPRPAGKITHLSPASTLYVRLFDAYRSEVMSPDEASKWENQTKRSREEPNDSGRTEIITGTVPDVFVKESSSSFMSITHDTAAQSHELDTIQGAQDLPPDTEGELTTQLRFAHDGTIVSAEIIRKFTAGGRTWRLGNIRFTPSADVMRTVRNYVWADVPDRV